MSLRLLIADDDGRARAEMGAALGRRGYDVIETACGEAAVERAVAEGCDAAFVAADESGRRALALSRWLRERSDLGIIVLGESGRELDAIEALDAGADDYVMKPPSIPRLLARVRAILRRTAQRRPTGVWRVGGSSVNLDTREVCRAGFSGHLTPKEFGLLCYLISHANRVASHRDLLRSAWGPEYGDHVDYLRVVINQLRRKIEPTPSKPVHILTVPWAGYRLQL